MSLPVRHASGYHLFRYNYVPNPWEMILPPDEAGLYQTNNEQKSTAYLLLTEWSKRLITALEIGVDQIRDIGGGVLACDREEIIGGGAAAAVTRDIVLQEEEEGIIAHSVVQGFEEVRTVEVRRIDVGAEGWVFVDIRIHIT